MDDAQPDCVEVVLIVESDRTIRCGLAQHLRKRGFSVVETADASEAKAAMKDGPNIDVILADAALNADNSGFALAHWTRRNRPNIPVILTTTTGNKFEAASGLARPCSRSRGRRR
jgi:CheY-like chemotaxis protein